MGAGAGEGAEVYVVIISPPRFWDLDRGLACFMRLSLVGRDCWVWDCGNSGEIAGC